MMSMLSVYHEMEKSGIAPDSESYSILYEVIAEMGDVAGLPEIDAHMRSLGKAPPRRRFLY